jgi:hypothetical protein
VRRLQGWRWSWRRSGRRELTPRCLAPSSRLAEACLHPSHAFWPEPVSPLQEGLILWERLLGPRQISDAYLLALASSQGGRFATFDQRIDVAVVPAASPANLCIIPADGLG